MRVLLLHPVCLGDDAVKPGKTRQFRAGRIVDIPENDARRLVDHGLARFVPDSRLSSSGGGGDKSEGVDSDRS